MKGSLNWQSPEIVNIFDEVNLWAAPFGRLMLEHVPMKKGASILDIGFGTGFPIIELAQRFGKDSKIYGIDIWSAAIKRCKEKIKQLDLNNVEIFEQSATRIPLADQSIDLICSNLGVNNFEDISEVLKECHRVLNANGEICITTNPKGTFNELFLIMEKVLQAEANENALTSLSNYLEHRGNPESIINKFHEAGFKKTKVLSDQTSMRFVDGMAVLNHSLIRIGFIESWISWFETDQLENFFTKLVVEINSIIKSEGTFEMTIPMLYLAFKK